VIRIEIDEIFGRVLRVDRHGVISDALGRQYQPYAMAQDIVVRGKQRQGIPHAYARRHQRLSNVR